MPNSPPGAYVPPTIPKAKPKLYQAEPRSEQIKPEELFKLCVKGKVKKWNPLGRSMRPFIYV